MPNPILDFSLDKVDWRAVASHIRAAAGTIAAGTPSPLDDLAVAQLGDTLIDLIVPKAHQTPDMFMGAAAASADSVGNPLIWMILTPILEAAVAKILERLRRKAA